MKITKFKQQFVVLALASLVCFALFICAGIARAAAAEGEPEGFAGLRWGTPMEGLQPMKYIGTDTAGIALYERPGDDHVYGGARVNSIEYGFKNGRLAMVTLKVNSLLHYLLMKEEAFRRYGEGEELAGRTDSYVWKGAATEISLISDFVIS